MEEIPAQEIIFHPHSFADPAGRLFSWQGQLYRGIRSEWMPVIERLFHDGVVQKLIERGLLVETQPTSLKADGYEMVLWHRCVPFASYPEEWCPAMLKDAALTQIDLVIELSRCGFTLKDAHPWNILFDAWKPVYVDFSSIVPMDGEDVWRGCEQFRRFYLNPLVLMAHGQDRIARRLLPELDGISNFEVTKLTRSSISFRSVAGAMSRSSSSLRRVAASLARRRSASPVRREEPNKKSYLTSLERLKHEVEEITFSLPQADGAEKKERSSSRPLSEKDWTVKQRNLHKILGALRPASILNTASDGGWSSRLAAGLGSEVVALDKELSRSTQLYYDVRRERLSILPLLMDFTDPTQPRGLCNHWAVPAADRLACELVLALSVMPEVVSKRYLNFEQIVEGLSLFSKRWLLVDFPPLEEGDAGRPNSQLAASYKLKHFIEALRKRFRKVNIQTSEPETGVMLVCEK